MPLGSHNLITEGEVVQALQAWGREERQKTLARRAIEILLVTRDLRALNDAELVALHDTLNSMVGEDAAA